MTLTQQRHPFSPDIEGVGPSRMSLAPMPERGHLRDLVQLMGGNVEGLASADEHLPITLWRVGQDATLLHEGAPALAVYVLRSGSMKCIKTLEDGYEQVVCFAQPGELLGFDAVHCRRQPTSVVALEHATAYALPMNELQALRQRCPAFDHALQLALSRQLARAAGTAEMMAAVASDVRLARFLLWMSSRMAECGQSPRRLLLRMCRRDIASLLGVAHETVSRSFTILAEAGHVKVENREVEILDLDLLRMRARSTRGPIEEAVRRRPQAPTVGRAAAPTLAWLPRSAACSAAAS